ncbi:MAG: 3-deoxy-manno-octulosonate cytidylyltransferase [Acidobacteriia bacterium]|nr:3-deoxy-manno-octulosonate cytidylyltransferase [Terriglobia bacterium]
MKDSLKVLGVIPARLDSKRLPGKVLRPIAGKAMVHWVYESARRSPLLSDLIVATDSEEVQHYCLDHDIPVTMTGSHPSGSDRLHEVMERTDGDVYVNIQGDEPTLRPDHLQLLLGPILAGDTEVATLMVAIGDAAARDPNNVKVVTDAKMRALYFSRFPIPFDRDGSGRIRYYKHIGLYAYTRAALALFHRLPQSSLELAEKLEQLRFLQNGVPILVVETQHDTVGVDTEADLRRVITLFDKQGMT